jgi:ribose 5-phosphate isomerase B
MIALGCDHGGYALKEAIKNHLKNKNISFTDFGTNSADSVDYAVYAQKVADAVKDGEATYGILVCSTGIGISMAANKVESIRAALCMNEFCAEMTRRHNNANVLCLGGMVVQEEEALNIVDKFLTSEFEGDRHTRRINQIADIENGKKLY